MGESKVGSWPSSGRDGAINPAPSCQSTALSNCSSTTYAHTPLGSAYLRHTMSVIPALGDARKQLNKLGKRIMKSHRVQIPKYDMPIRLRPVSFLGLFARLQCSCSLVVSSPHMCHHGWPWAPWLHEFLPCIATK